MKVFVTGASGWIGSAVTDELLAHGHQVLGLARTDAAAERLAATGAQVQRGDLDDLDSLRAGADQAEAVIHLAFKHDFANFAASGVAERAAVQAFLDTLEGSGRPFLLASGVALKPGTVLTEDVAATNVGPDSPRGGSEALALEYADRGVRSVALRFAASVHAVGGDHGFIKTIADVAREHGAAGYIGDGANRWPAVHRADAARMVRLALEKAPAGTVAHAVGEEGIATRDIAAALAERLGVPTVSIAPEDAAEHFGWISMFFGLDIRASSAKTQALLDWTPAGPTLFEDIAAGGYDA